MRYARTMPFEDIISAALVTESWECPECGVVTGPPEPGAEGTVGHVCLGRAWRPWRFRGRVPTGVPLGLLGWLAQQP